MTTIYLKALPSAIDILADIDGIGYLKAMPFHDLVRPGESFGGYTYAELLEIAKTRGKMDADELRV